VAAQDTNESTSRVESAAEKAWYAAEGGRRDLFCHAMVAIESDDEALLGVVHARIWTRSPPSRYRAPVAGERRQGKSFDGSRRRRLLWTSQQALHK